MKKESYLSFLILCAVLSQGIAVLSDENIAEVSLRLHSRTKRVIDLTRNGGRPIYLSRAPYIVNILKNGMSHCAGAILDADIIITNTNCIAEIPRVTYTILSGSEWRHNGTIHRITRRNLNPAFDFEVFKITPPININNGVNRKIDLFLGNVLPESYGTFSGWGCKVKGSRFDVRYPRQLLQTRLPMINNVECGIIENEEISNEYVCTLDRSKRRATCNGDAGGPLVYGNRLLGILFRTGVHTGVQPDIFVNLNHQDVHHWITLNINMLRNIH